MRKVIFMSLSALMLCACSQRHVYTVSDGKSKNNPVQVESIRKTLPYLTGETGVVGMRPNATAFRMSGDYSKNVAVTLAPNGDLLYFPDPTDITADSQPIYLGEGWWLNRQGFGANSAFTKYTFAEYAELPRVPSVEQLKNSIIPGAKVTEFVELPIKLDDAIQDPAAAAALLKNQ